MADLPLHRGDSLVYHLQVVTDPVSGAIASCRPNQPPPGFVPLNLTGYHVWFTVKLYVSDPDSSAVWLLDNQSRGGVTIPAPTTGIVNVLGAAAATVQFPDGPLVMSYDCEIVSPSGVVTTPEDGTITLGPDATRSTT